MFKYIYNNQFGFRLNTAQGNTEIQTRPPYLVYAAGQGGALWLWWRKPATTLDKYAALLVLEFHGKTRKFIIFVYNRNPFIQEDDLTT